MKTIIRQHHANFIQLLGAIRVPNGPESMTDVFAGIEHACNLVMDSAQCGGKMMFIGNGGSAAIASHMAIDFWKNGGVPALAFNDGPLLTCISNEYGYARVFEKPIEMFAKGGDLLFAISSGGRSENILNGVAAARAKGCRVITMSGFDDGNPLSSRGDVNFYVASSQYGPVEVAHQYICHWILDTVIAVKK